MNQITPWNLSLDATKHVAQWRMEQNYPFEVHID